MTRPNSWSTEEESLLRDNYLLPWDELLRLFPNRTRKSLTHRLGILGLKRPTTILSTENEEYIREQIYYKTANEIARDIGVSKTTIHRFLANNEIKLNSRNWELADIQVVDGDIFSIQTTYKMDLGGENK